MIAVLYFTGSGHSRAVAEYFAEKLDCDAVSIGSVSATQLCSAETALIVFPVYCQNIPKPVKDFLKRIQAENIVLIATYGNISHGNVLFEAQKIVSGNVIAGAYVPIGHTFLNGDTSFEIEPLKPILDRIKSPEKIYIPRSSKQFFADILPSLRSRLGTRIYRSDRCDMCNLCGEKCPMNGIKNGIPNSRCIRCLRCVSSCPQKALRFENTKILYQYLLRNSKNRETVVYL